NRLSTVNSLAVRPAQLQATTADPAVHVQQIPSPVGVRRIMAARSTRQPEAIPRRGALIELAEIVEKDLRIRLCREPRTHRRVRDQIAQHAITNASSWHGPQLFFDTP